jgi:hypothetical protein
MARGPDEPRDGIIFAQAGGSRLPVIDITNPRFAVPTSPAEMEALRQAYLHDEQRQDLIPPFVMRWMLRSAAKRSRLFRAVFASQTGFVDAISTYVMKLGADNLPPGFDTPTDRMFAASPHVTLLRLRMAQIAHLLADGLHEDLAARPARPLTLLNIGGGPAFDSLNALILLKQADPALLDRPVSVIVMDVQAEGPRFGARALAALKGKGGPLSRIRASFTHRLYDWNEPHALEQLLGNLALQGTIIAASSEGALFEYGSEDAIRANLRVLHRGGACLVAGSVTASDGARWRLIATSGLRIVPRGLDGFTPLASETGWTIARTESAILSEQVLLAELNPKARMPLKCAPGRRGLPDTGARYAA